jgi:drug/metabolite transporter (DMT)-like permease
LRTLAAAAMLVAVLKAQGAPLVPTARVARAAAGLGVVVAAYSYCLFSAIAAMPVALAVLTFYTWPLMVGVASWASGSERLTWKWPIAAGAALTGLALALDAFHTTPNLAGTALALIGAVGWSATLMLNRRLVGGGDSRPVTLHMMLAASAANALAMVAGGGFEAPHGTPGWLAMAGAVGAYCFAIVGTFAAAAISGPVRTALVMNSEPIASLVFSALLLDQVLEPLQILGAFVVVGSIVMARQASAPAQIRSAAN